MDVVVRASANASIEPDWTVLGGQFLKRDMAAQQIIVVGREFKNPTTSCLNCPKRNI